MNEKSNRLMLQEEKENLIKLAEHLRDWLDTALMELDKIKTSEDGYVNYFEDTTTSEAFVKAFSCFVMYLNAEYQENAIDLAHYHNILDEIEAYF